MQEGAEDWGIELQFEIDLGRSDLLSSLYLLATAAAAAAGGPSRPRICSLLQDRGVLRWYHKLGCFCYLLKVVTSPPLALFCFIVHPSEMGLC